MFGYHEIPLHIEQDGILLSVQREGENLLYKRVCLEEEVEKTLLVGSSRMLLNPVEPVNKPKSLASYLLIELEKTMQIEPKGIRDIFLTFPVEIAAYISVNKDSELIDVFTLSRQKLSLYGDPINGVICKYWKSSVYSSEPSLNRMQEGLIELSVTNTTTSWIEVTKAVFSAYGMKIYYDDEKAAMKANMRLKGRQSAETEFIDEPVAEGMTKSLEIYTPRNLSGARKKFAMEFGV